MNNGLPTPAASAAPNGAWAGSTGKKDGWFKNPRNTSWTIDSLVNGKSKPAGYDSNTLITVIRSSQCFCAGMTLIFYIGTMSAPTQWLMFLAIAVGALSVCWSMCVLFMRHIWSMWLVIPEVLIAIAWIVLYTINTMETPDEAKAKLFQVAMVAIEASMVVWIQTCLLVVTPFFHKLFSYIRRKRQARKARKASQPPNVTPGSIDLVS
ncbi:hypothetical protein GGR53DRAFT_135909 [Hypoxylon sp. FL1150]|nr:hypothetical protein GGR53DRAFT_135909 [Hypoxylon sp. FL1150]